MNITSLTRLNLFLLLVLSFNTYAQDDTTSVRENSMVNRQRLGFLAMDYHIPVPTGQNYVGLGMEGHSGYTLKAQIYVYKQFFISGSVGSDYLRVVDPSITGNYDKTTLDNQYLSIGYEFLPFKKTRLGVNIAVVGSVLYKNTSNTGSKKAIQNDSGKLKSYEVYFDYEIGDYFSVYFNYGFRNDKMNIEAPPELKANFERASFHTFGLGLKFSFGEFDILSSN